MADEANLKSVLVVSYVEPRKCSVTTFNAVLKNPVLLHGRMPLLLAVVNIEPKVLERDICMHICKYGCLKPNSLILKGVFQNNTPGKILWTTDDFNQPLLLYNNHKSMHFWLISFVRLRDRC